MGDKNGERKKDLASMIGQDSAKAIQSLSE